MSVKDPALTGSSGGVFCTVGLSVQITFVTLSAKTILMLLHKAGFRREGHRFCYLGSLLFASSIISACIDLFIQIYREWKLTGPHRYLLRRASPLIG